jgi:hypothetical protein
MAAAIPVVAGCRPESASESAERRTQVVLHAPTWPTDVMGSQVSLSDSDSAEFRAKLPKCREADPTITPNGIGPLTTSETMAAGLQTCPDPFVAWEMGDEAIPEPAAMVLLGDAAVEIVFADTSLSSRVSRIMVKDTAAHFAAGPRPGYPLQAFIDRFGPIEVEDIECGLHATFDSMPGVDLWLGMPGDIDCTKTQELSDSIKSGGLRTGVTAGRITVFARALNER